MAAFSFSHDAFQVDSVFSACTAVKISGFSGQGTIGTSSFPQLNPTEPIQQSPTDAGLHENGCLLHHSSNTVLSENETSATHKQSTESSTVVDDIERGEQVIQKLPPVGKKRKTRNKSLLSLDRGEAAADEANSIRQKKENHSARDEGEKEASGKKKYQHKVPEEPSAGFIHVRARRGQATDSHSLAERVRREKISERMKMLQRLVPGCDKVTGKALVLDEIINYVQSLQNQVEFLSMRLASVSPVYCDFGMGTDMDTLIGRSQTFNRISSQLQSNSSNALPTAFVDTASAIPTFAASNSFPLLDPSASLLLPQEQRTDTFSLDDVRLLCDAEELRQKFMVAPGFGNNSGSFR